MKAKYKGMEVDGTPEEIVKLFRLLNDDPKDKPFVPMAQGTLSTRN